MREIIKDRGFFSFGCERFICDICGRSAEGPVAAYFPVWEDCGFIRLRAGIARREKLICISRRDAEVKRFLRKVA
ncbi:MAG: hypothetical protein L0209_06885 [candidate division Zixibacteria bacterium]|nr:hypothetical protein [candidate division Zixibacteria bacterium]